MHKQVPSQSKVPKEIGIREGSRHRVFKTIVGNEEALRMLVAHLHRFLENAAFSNRDMVVTPSFDLNITDEEALSSADTELRSFLGNTKQIGAEMLVVVDFKDKKSS